MGASATSLHIHHRENGTHTFMLTHHIQYCFHIKVYCVFVVCQGLVSEDANEPKILRACLYVFMCGCTKQYALMFV